MAKNPANTGITIDGSSFNAFSTQAGIASVADNNSGMPLMGSMTSVLEFSVDVHDQTNVSFEVLRKLFHLCYLPTSEKVKDVKLEFWTDDSKKDVIFSLSFKGWISSWNVSSGGGSNHILSITLQPALDKNQYLEMSIGN